MRCRVINQGIPNMRFFSSIAAAVLPILLAFSPAANAGVVEDWNELISDYITETNMAPIVRIHYISAS